MRRNPTRRQSRDALRAWSAIAVDRDKAAAADAALGLDRPERQRAKPRDLEGAEQRALFRWARLAQSKWPDLRWLHHVPNGGHRDFRVAAKLKTEGVKRGVPDIYLDVARGGWHALRIELKAPGGRMTPEQRDWIAELNARGFRAVVCFGWQAARAEIEGYLGGTTK